MTLQPMPGLGSEGLTGHKVRMARGATQLVVGRKLGEGSQGLVHEVMLDGRPLALKWLRTSPFEHEQRGAIARLAARPRPHPSFAWPIDVVESDELSGFGYVMPLLDPRFTSLAGVLNEVRQPSFRILVGIGRHLVDAFAALHAAGLCYRDVSFGNLRVDPRSADVMIIDNDNVGTDGDAAFVRGTRRFMAPEILRGEALPSSTTDFYSLAVLLFHLLVHGHPLEGARVLAKYDWSLDGEEENDIVLEHFGHHPVFVFDPDDATNRPPVDDPMARWWPIYPAFLRSLFERAFTNGLRDPESADRCTEGRWRRALARLDDCIWLCRACRAATFWDPDEPGRPCWACTERSEPPYLLDLYSRRVVLVDGASAEVGTGADALKARAETHPSLSGAFVLRNTGTLAWTVAPQGEDLKVVVPGQRALVRAMDIACGEHRARISLAPSY